MARAKVLRLITKQAQHFQKKKKTKSNLISEGTNTTKKNAETQGSI
jgi:hypothetical protein